MFALPSCNSSWRSGACSSNRSSVRKMALESVPPGSVGTTADGEMKLASVEPPVHGRETI